MKVIKRIVVFITIVCITFSNISYASSMTQEKAGETLAEFAINFFNKYGSETKYYNEDDLLEVRGRTYNGEKVNGAYQLDCVGWINFAVHQSLKMDTPAHGSTDGFAIPPKNNSPGFYHGFEFVTGSTNANNVLSRETVEKTVKPGDILFCNGQHVVLYVGNNKIIHCYTNLEYEDLYGNDMNYTGYCAIGRITAEAAAKLDSNNVTTIFNSVTGASKGLAKDDIGKYYGTTEGHYAGSYTLGEWLFSKFVGFFDYVAGILTYVFKAQFLGWGNIVEVLINDAICKSTGMETAVVGENTSSETSNSSDESTTTNNNTLYKPSATNMNSRIDIEDIIYNRVPFLDVNFLDVDLDKYKTLEEEQRRQASTGDKIQVLSKDSIVYSLRANIAKWYIVIRQICIIILLLMLIYLGIRLAIATTAGGKAVYKTMLVSWLTSFILVFGIHYYMILVIDINEFFVDTFSKVAQNAIDESDNGTGSQSIYDTIRTRAYSLKLSEGWPATIFYMVLIYFLIRFLFIYIKRYFTVMILALIGPVMATKNCFDVVTTGKSKKAMGKWMMDFAMNVFLQTIHAVLYCIFMVMAFDLSTTSIPGFVMALIFLNFIFKAEKIFMNIFKFDGSSLRDVNQSKNYFAEAYKVATGVAFFGGDIAKHSFGIVKGSGKFLGQTTLATAQIGTSAINRLSWAIKNNKSIKHGNGAIEYTPIDLTESLKNKATNVANSAADKANDFLEKKTPFGRSLRLDMHNMEKRDPELYEQTKQALKLKKETRRKTMKRAFGSSVNSIRYMAELMAGIPMLVVDTQSGFSTLMDARSGLANASKRKVGYGHGKKKSNAATKALNAATFGAVNSTLNSVDNFKKDHKAIKKNGIVMNDLEKANALERKINLEVDKMVKAGREKEEVEKQMKAALAEVMSASKIKDAVSRYMVQKGMKEISESDLNEIVDAINSEIFGSSVDKSIEKYIKKAKKDKLDPEDIDKILDSIGKKVESGVSAVLNDESSGDASHKKIKEKIKKHMEDSGVDKIDADTAKELLKSDESKSDFGIGTTDEVKRGIEAVSKGTGKKPQKTFDKKQAVSAIEDAMLAGTTKASSSDLSKMLRELKTLKEKSKNNNGTTIVDLAEFTKGLSDKFE